MTENDISFKIRGSIFKVYNTLGPGLLESAYSNVLVYELTKQGLDVKKELALPLIYENEKLDVGYRIDIMVNDLVIIEIKSVEKLLDVHHKQVLTYLKLSGKKLGILVNFNTNDIEGSIFRKVNNL
jgi:GxxExxY protein